MGHEDLSSMHVTLLGQSHVFLSYLIMSTVISLFGDVDGAHCISPFVARFVMPAGEFGVVMVIPHAVLAVIGVVGLSAIPGQEGLWVAVTVHVYTVRCLVIHAHIHLTTGPAEIVI